MRFFKYLCLYFILSTTSIPTYAQTDCESHTATFLSTLTDLLNRNDFARIQAMTSSLAATCGETELQLRLQIIDALINQQQSAALIERYRDKKFDEKLVHRYDNANQKNYASIYRKDKAYFDFIPLRHAVDSLIQVKAQALLQSSTYKLTRQEEAIALLFADQIEAYYALLGLRPPARPTIDAISERENNKAKTAGVLYSGVFMPIGKNDYLKTSPTFGVTLMGPLSRKFVWELGLKFRINTNNASFDFVDEGQVKEINSRSSYFMGGTIGYKAMDRGPWIILPKIGAGLGFINTKLSRVTIYDSYTDEGEGDGIQYNNANTLHSTAGLAIMHHIKKKMYVGLELDYHYVPYNWDKDLITRINNKFASVELFLRF